MSSSTEGLRHRKNAGFNFWGLFIVLGCFWLHWVFIAIQGAQATWPFMVVAQRFSCSVACGLLVPQPRIEPTCPALPSGFLITGLPGKSKNFSY